MASGSNNFNTFSENQLITFRAVQAVLWQIGIQYELEGLESTPQELKSTLTGRVKNFLGANHPNPSANRTLFRGEISQATAYIRSPAPIVRNELPCRAQRQCSDGYW